MTTATITWHPGAESASGSVAATVAMSRKDWEASGATFATVEGGNGHDASLATGSVEVDGNLTDFAVLDYGGDVTYVVVGGEYEQRPNLTTRIVDELIAATAIPDEATVLEIVGLEQRATTDEKIDYALGVLGAQVAQVHESMRRTLEAVNAQVAHIGDLPRVPALSPDESILAPRYLAIRHLQTLQGEARRHGHHTPVAILAPSELLALLAGADEEISTELVLFQPDVGDAIVSVLAGSRLWDLRLTGVAPGWHGLDEFDVIIGEPGWGHFNATGILPSGERSTYSSKGRARKPGPRRLRFVIRR